VAIEIEKKYRLTSSDMEAVADSLSEFAAEFCGETFEENILFSSNELVQKGRVVRLRITGSRSTLTFKQRQTASSDAKRHLEYETEVADPVAARAILEMLDLHPVLVYEKKRKTYKFRAVEVVLDELPFGLFMEIEGPLSAIKEAEMLLELEDLPVEYETYPRLTARLGVKVGDVVEARFT
jgi:adenylate cyclase class 2